MVSTRCPRARTGCRRASRRSLAGVRYTKRRVEFLTRRWTAKRAVATVLGRGLEPAALASVEIRPPRQRRALRGGGRAAAAAIDVSISDRAGWAVCLVGPPGGASGPLGIDLELVEPRSDAFVERFLHRRRERRCAPPASRRGARRGRQPDLVGQGGGVEGAQGRAARRHARSRGRVRRRQRRPDGWAPLSVTGARRLGLPGLVAA